LICSTGAIAEQTRQITPGENAELVNVEDLQLGTTEASTSVPDAVLRRDARSSNTSELFAKVLELEESIRNLTGRLQQSEHAYATLAKKLDGFDNKTSSPEPVYGVASSSVISDATKLIQAGKNTEAIELLTTQLQKVKEGSIENPGELYYWLAKAHMNAKSSDKAAHYFVKSYKHNTDVTKNILVELIETLAVDKKYKQICPLLSKLDVKYLNSISAEKKARIKALERSHCLHN
jgi:TolA-binding protein